MTETTLADLPRDELLRYGRELGLVLKDDTPQGELLRRVRGRQEMLIELDREALLDIVKWARHPVRASAGKEQLSKEIATVGKMNFAGLSHRGLVALARLRNIDVTEGVSHDEIIRKLKKAEGFWAKMERKRRKLVGAWLTRMVEDADTGDNYTFLPEESGGTSLKEGIEERGVVGGIASKLRGVADDYVRDKLNEIEARIDRKLDEIDGRLGEWRDREVSNRLKILKITLIVSILVALLSLGYDCVRNRIVERPAETQQQTDDRADSRLMTFPPDLFG